MELFQEKTKNIIKIKTPNRKKSQTDTPLQEVLGNFSTQEILILTIVSENKTATD